MLRVVVACPPRVLQPADLATLPSCADLVELRLDLLPAARDVAALEAWVAASPRPVLATVRSVREGGGFGGTPAEAARWLDEAAQAGAAWLDAEADVLPLLAERVPGVRVVASSHAARLDVPAAAAGTVLKHAGGLADAAGLSAYRSALEREGPPRAIMPTGPLAALRVLDARAALLYGSAPLPGEMVAEGMPPALCALVDELRAGEVSSQAGLFGLLGAPPSPSPSPALHNAVFRAQGRDALYVPLPGLGLQQALALPLLGLSVTTPWKEQALAAATSADALARALGAANTLVRTSEGGWHASNTDALALRAAVPLAGPGEQAVVHGAGGYARAALVALREAGYAVRVVARDRARAQALAAWAGVEPAGTRWEPRAQDRVLVNATPAGWDGAAVPALEQAVQGRLRDMLVLDAPYGPAGRPAWLASQARAQQARLLDGEDLLRAQALGQAQAFAQAGHAVALRLLGSVSLEEVLWLALRPRTSVSLVGLRGAGKSTVGRALAQRLGRPFVDLDEEVLRQTGRSSAAWIERAGLEAFRSVEAQALARLEGRRGLVVATGGGVLERRENAARLRALGPVAWLDATAGLCADRVAQDASPRPLLAGAGSRLEEAQQLKARRDPHYAAVATLRLRADLPLADLLASLHEHWAGFEAEARRPDGAGALRA
ncbi:MAG: type I 3-dehydroquinate dehydratase [Planctomycetia bacterium]